jgi:hypothetical protein
VLREKILYFHYIKYKEAPVPIAEPTAEPIPAELVALACCAAAYAWFAD